MIRTLSLAEVTGSSFSVGKVETHGGSWQRPRGGGRWGRARVLMSHVNSGSDPPPPALKAQDARGAPFSNGNPYSGSPSPNPKLSVGVPWVGLLRARPGATGGPRWGQRVFLCWGSGAGGGLQGQETFWGCRDRETSGPAERRRQPRSQTRLSGLPSNRLEVPLRPVPAVGTTRLVPCPLFPAGGAGGFGCSQDRCWVPRELSTAVRDRSPSEGCAHQKPMGSPLANQSRGEAFSTESGG